MGHKFNGNLKWIITVGVISAGIIASYAVLGRDVAEMKPEVKLNSAHRIKEEEKDKRIEDKLDSILTAVSK